MIDYIINVVACVSAALAKYLMNQTMDFNKGFSIGYTADYIVETPKFKMANFANTEIALAQSISQIVAESNF